MTDEKSIVSRSFTRYEVKKLGCWALLVFVVMELTLCSVFNQPILNLQQVMTSGFKMLMSNEEMTKLPQLNTQLETTKSIYNFSNSRSDLYEMYGDIRIQSNSSSIFVDPNSHSRNISSWSVRPYARKFDNIKIEPIREWKIQISEPTQFPNCNRHFSIPAIAFSAGSFSGNYFHAFADVLFPLYVTSRQFNRTVLFLVSNSQPWWLVKFKEILENLSKYDILNIDQQNEVLCFNRVIVGLKADKEMDIDTAASQHYSITDFRQFLRETYLLERKTINDCYRNCSRNRRPRVLIVSRKRNRRLRNEEQLATMAQELGADVELKEMESNMSTSARDVNSFDVLIGLHGAGLTNMVFLPDNAVLVQIIPFALDVASYNFFGRPSRGMNLRYVEYKVSINESSLSGKYPPNSEVFTNPHAIHMKGFALFHTIYLANQEVTLDLARFRATLVYALKLVLR